MRGGRDFFFFFQTIKTTNPMSCMHFEFKIDEYDQLPNYICVDCWCLLQQFHEFYRRVIETQNRFLLNSEPAIKLELMTDEPVQVNSYVEDCK